MALATAENWTRRCVKLEGALDPREDAIAEKAAEIHNALGHLRFEQQNWSEAQRHYAKVAEREAKYPTAHYNLALCLERQAKFDEAAKEFEAALAIDPKRWQAQMGRGLCLLRMNQRGRGSRLAGKRRRTNFLLRKKTQRQNDILFGKAVTLHQLGRLKEAAELYQKLLPLESQLHRSAEQHCYAGGCA